MRERLVRRRRRRGRRGRCSRLQFRALQIRRGEGGDVVPDRRRELRDGLLDLGWVIVRLRLVDFGDPACRK
jgi:hypothetical protein